jgi:2-polyprenyl-3-methyl-5-hydroxy-6-metoxy-1,4-benzoquinol methylase
MSEAAYECDLELTDEPPVTMDVRATAGGGGGGAGAAAALDTAGCECCGSDDHSPIARKRGHVLHRCRGCGVLFVFPQPTAEELAALYRKSSGYFATAGTDLSSVRASSAHWLENALLKGGVAGGRFLDVGCANGALMYAMRGLGWTVSGVDVNGDAVDIATSNGLDARVGTLESAGFVPESFDVVCLGDVIEHVPSPRRVCAEVHRILRPGGVIVLRTPNAECGYAAITLAAARLLGARSWAHAEAPYHLHEFTPRSLERMLDSTGFDVAWNRCEGRGRFLYKLGATGAFDRLKQRMKERAGRAALLRAFPAAPLILALGALLAPAYAAGTALDALTGGGMAIFIGAKKRRA